MEAGHLQLFLVPSAGRSPTPSLRLRLEVFSPSSQRAPVVRLPHSCGLELSMGTLSSSSSSRYRNFQWSSRSKDGTQRHNEFVSISKVRLLVEEKLVSE